MNPGRIPTIRQLAAWAGVSNSTISRALRNHPGIPNRTRLRIQRLAKRKGYRFDPVVATLMTALRTRRTDREPERLGFLNSWPQNIARKTVNLLENFAGARRRAQELGYELEEIWSKEPGMTAARLSRILYTRSIRGLIVGPLLPSVGHVSLKWEHFAVVAMGHTIAKPDLHRVSQDHFAGMQTVLRHLRHLEYRRIGFVAPVDQIMRTGARWLASYLLYQSTLPARSRIPHLLLGASPQLKLEKWIRQYRIDAIVGNTVAVLEAIRDLGHAVPGEIGFAALDLVQDQYDSAGIDQRPASEGYAAADMLIKNLQQNEFGLPAEHKMLYIEGSWKKGRTVRSKVCRFPVE